MKYLLNIALVLGLAFAATAQPAPGALVRVNAKAEAVAVPQILAVSNAVVTVFGTNNSTSGGRVLLRTLQNTGTNAVLYLINPSSTVSSTNYHGVLAGGVAVRDGLGSVLDLSKVPYPVSLITESANGTTVAVVELTQ
jgi:hypothetical protein